VEPEFIKKCLHGNRVILPRNPSCVMDIMYTSCQTKNENIVVEILLDISNVARLCISLDIY